MKNLCLMKLQGLLVVFFCSFTFYSCETEESEDVLQKSNSVSEKKCINGYIPDGNVKTLTLPNELKVSVDEAGNYFHEDIVFPKQVIDSISKQGPMTRGAITSNHTLYWTDNFVPYEIAPEFSTYEEHLIEKAIEMITNNSYLTFVRGIEDYKCGIYFYPSNNGTYTNMIGKNLYGYNLVYLQSKGFRIGNVLHEIMHSLGFCHELSRNDRDKYVTVLYRNIDFYNSDKFDKKDNILFANKFDYESIMMYNSYDHTKNGRPTILAKNWNPIFALRDDLSPGDIKALNFLYGPNIYLKSVPSKIDNEKGITSEFKNVLYFLDRNGKSVALKYPRLFIYRTFKKLETPQKHDYDIEYSGLNYTYIPAGIRFQELNPTIFKVFKDKRNTQFLTEHGYQIMN